MPASPAVAKPLKLPEPAPEPDQELKALVSQIQEARKTADESARKLYEAASLLYEKARRNPIEGASAYVIFANAHLRMANALGQGLRRTASTDRVLKIARDEQEEERRRASVEEEHRKIREGQRRIQKLTLTSDNAFDEVYGGFDEEMSHA
jgi:hypothetical protein